jgi:hypothetical protein
MNAYQYVKTVFPSIALLALLCCAAAVVDGCKKNDNNPVTTQPPPTTTSTTADVADEVSDALAGNNGGAMDQANDVFELAGGVGVGANMGLAKTASDSTYINRTYDPATQSWSVSLYKLRSIAPLYYGLWTRNYWHQFRANGKAQQFRITGGVTADTILHKLLGGTGYYYTPRLVHHLHAISSNWVVSNTNTDTVTINGTYARSGVDTIKAAARAGRVFDHALTLNFINVKGPRGLRYARSEKTTGTIQGTYTATVTIPGNAPFTTTKTFTIVLNGGMGTFTVDGTTYSADLATGDH